MFLSCIKFENCISICIYLFLCSLFSYQCSIFIYYQGFFFNIPKNCFKKSDLNAFAFRLNRFDCSPVRSPLPLLTNLTSTVAPAPFPLIYYARIHISIAITCNQNILLINNVTLNNYFRHISFLTQHNDQPTPQSKLQSETETEPKPTPIPMQCICICCVGTCSIRN